MSQMDSFFCDNERIREKKGDFKIYSTEKLQMWIVKNRFKFCNVISYIGKKEILTTYA